LSNAFALPVIGIGAISTVAGAVIGDAACATLIVAFALAALAMRVIR
jgi:hypothetical protein